MAVAASPQSPLQSSPPQQTPPAGVAEPPPGVDAAPSPTESLTHNVLQLLRELPGLVSDRVQLLALELKRSGLALAQMVGLVVAAGVLLCTAWLALWVGIGVALVQAGLGWGWTLALILLLNLGAAWLAVKRALSLARFLSLPATVRRLTLSSAPAPAPRDGGAKAPPTSAGATDERATAAAGTP